MLLLIRLVLKDHSAGPDEDKLNGDPNLILPVSEPAKRRHEQIHIFPRESRSPVSLQPGAAPHLLHRAGNQNLNRRLPQNLGGERADHHEFYIK